MSVVVWANQMICIKKGTGNGANLWFHFVLLPPKYFHWIHNNKWTEHCRSSPSFIEWRVYSALLDTALLLSTFILCASVCMCVCSPTIVVAFRSGSCGLVISIDAFFATFTKANKKKLWLITFFCAFIFLLIISLFWWEMVRDGESHHLIFIKCAHTNYQHRWPITTRAIVPDSVWIVGVFSFAHCHSTESQNN